MSIKAEETIQKIRERFSPLFKQEGDVTTPTDLGIPGFNSTKAFINNFSKIDHFVIELIQNAEDSQSKEFKLIIEENKITIINNGKEFDNNDVKALCSFGEGTKKDKPEYIGFFGAGFKSVFKISNNPEIYSGEFKFRFDNNTFYIPTIINNSNPHPRNTTVILPFRKELTPNKLNDIENQISNLKPEIILFLKHLEKIVIVNKIRNEEIIFHKKLKNDFYELYNKQKLVGRWIVKNKRFPIDDVAFNSLEKDEREKREKAKIRAVHVAFNIDGNNNLQETQGKLFAFLPTKYDTGLKFLINSDFIITPDREKINEDSYWNEWLFKCAGKLINECVEEFKKNDILKYQFYKILPKRYETSNRITQNLFEEIHNYFLEEKVAITEDGVWTTLQNVYYLDNSEFEILNLLTNKEFLELTSRKVLSQKLEFGCVEFLKGIYLEDYNTDKFIDLLKTLNNSDWIKQKKTKWFMDLFTFISNKYGTTSSNILTKIKDLKVIKLGDNSFFSLEDIEKNTPAKSIYYPSKELNIDDELKKFFSDDIKFLNTEIYSLLQTDYKHLSQFFRFTLNRYIKEIDYSNLINDFILLKFESDSYSNQELMGLTHYIASKFDELNEEIKNNVRDKIKLRTKSDRWVKPKNIFFSKIYSGDDLFDQLSEIDSVNVLSKEYLEIKSNKTEWFDFFKKIGISSKFPIEELGSVRNGIGGWDESKTCPILVNVFEKISDFEKTKRIKVAKKIFKTIDDDWSYYKDHLFITKYDEKKDSGEIIEITPIETPTEFLNILKESHWIPNTSDDFFPSNELFLDIEIIKNYDKTLPRINIGYKLDNKDLIDKLSIRDKLEVEVYISNLRTLKKNKKSFGYSDVEEIYLNILASLKKTTEKKKEEIKELFEIEDLIFLPSKNCPNFWTNSKDAFLCHNKFIKDYISGISNLYNEKVCSKLFTDILNITEESPSGKNYLQAIDNIKELKLNKKIKEDVLRFYFELNDDFEKFDSPYWWDEFNEGEYLLSSRGNFCNKKDVLFDDDKNKISSLYEDEIDLLYLPELTLKPKINVLLDKLSLPKISDEVNITLIDLVSWEKKSLREYNDKIYLFERGIKNFLVKHYNKSIDGSIAFNKITLNFVTEIKARIKLRKIVKTDLFEEFYDKKLKTIYLKKNHDFDIINYKKPLSKAISKIYETPALSSHIYELIQECIIQRMDIIKFYREEGISISDDEMNLDEENTLSKEKVKVSKTKSSQTTEPDNEPSYENDSEPDLTVEEESSYYNLDKEKEDIETEPNFDIKGKAIVPKPGINIPIIPEEKENVETEPNFDIKEKAIVPKPGINIPIIPEGEKTYNPHFDKDKQDYYQTDKWNSIRDQVLESADYLCSLCGEKGKQIGGIKILQAHHLNRERFGNELLEDLSCVCRECHEKLHDRKFSNDLPKKIKEIIEKEKEVEKKEKTLSVKEETFEKERKKKEETIQDLKEQIETIKKGHTTSPSSDSGFLTGMKKLFRPKKPQNYETITNLDEPLSIEERDQIENNIKKELEQEIIDIRNENKKRTYKKFLEPISKKEDVNLEVKNYYNGKCQICGSTFKSNIGENYCEIVDIIPKRYGGVRFTGNKLCLCPNHAAIVKHGDFDLEEFKNIDKNEVNVRINFKKAKIKYAREHMLALKVLLNIGKDK